MRRKYKIIIIILISIILTYFIYFFNFEHKINLVVIGDGIASGETPFNIDGISYNDYLKDYLESNHLLKNYNDSYAKKNYKLKELVEDIEENKLNRKNKLFVQQILHKANLITINIGEEELVKLAMTKDLNTETIKDFIDNYERLIYLLKDVSEARIVLISLYENRYLDKSNTIIINSELANIANKYDITIININDLMLNETYYLNKQSFYFNYRGHQEIAKIIVHSL